MDPRALPADRPHASSPERSGPTLTSCLRQIAGGVHSAVPGTDGVGVTLMVEGRPVFAGSNLFTEAVDEIQYGLGQGPCLAAVESGEVVRSRTIGSGEPRWRRFCQEATAVELRSVASAPIRSGPDVVGSLNLYARSAGQLDSVSDRSLLGRTRTVEQLVAGAVLVQVTDVGVGALARAVDDHAVVARATGLLVDRHRVPRHEAREVLRRMAARVGKDEPTMARLLLDASVEAAGRGAGAGRG